MPASIPRRQPGRKPSVSEAYPPQPKNPKTRRRIIKFTLFAAAFVAAFLFLKSPRAQYVTDLRLFHHTPPIHKKPPAQKNSTSGDVHWFNDWKWLKPFSATVTLDDDRSVLPPLQKRPPIYTFYDSDAEKDENVRDAENKLILTWRRAWWAQGFRPVVLGPSEAMQNPHYERFQSKKFEPQVRADLLRWMAWGHMGSGVLANYLCLPMGPHEDILLSYLRRGEYPKLTRYQNIGTALFSGEEVVLNNVLKKVIDSPATQDAKTLLDAVPEKTFTVDPNPSAIAFYDVNTIAKHYKALNTKLDENKGQGLLSLAQLVTSHLHLTFLNTFDHGLAVLSPFPGKLTILGRSAQRVATALRSCPSSPLPDSCPPNDPSCTPCKSITPAPVSTPETYTNSSQLYTISVLPHPYTMASLLGKRFEITPRHIRRDTARDRWLGAITDKLLGRDRGGPSRLVAFKESVASDLGVGRGFWMVEDPIPSHKDMEYHFGFQIEAFNMTDSDALKAFEEAKDDSKTPKAERKEKEKDLKLQTDLMAAAQEIVRYKRKKKEKTGPKEMVEAWNLADTEAWRFVRAFRARERVEREKWEIEERKFAGADEDLGRGWRWFDRRWV